MVDQYNVLTILNVVDFHHYSRIKKDCDTAKIDVNLPLVDDMLCISYVAPLDKQKFLSILRHNGVKFEDYKMTVPVNEVQKVMTKAMTRKTFKEGSYVKASGYGNLPLKVVSHDGDMVTLSIELFNFKQEIKIHSNQVTEHDRVDEFSMSHNPPKEYSSVMVVDVPYVISTLGEMNIDSILLFLIRIKTNMSKCKIVLSSPVVGNDVVFAEVAKYLGLSHTSSRFVKSKYCISDNTELVMMSDNHVKVSNRGEISISSMTEAHKYIMYLNEFTEKRINEEYILRMYDNIDSSSKSAFLEHLERIETICNHSYVQQFPFDINKMYKWVDDLGYGWFVENLSLYARIIRG